MEKSEKTKRNGIAAAAIIHSRTRYGDFREGLLARPADMTREQVYRWKQQILRCTREPEEMRDGHQVRRAVMGDGVYGAVGVAAYFRDIATGSFEDEGRRPAYGFVGFGWKSAPFFSPSAFPSIADFRDLTERYVVPRWEEPKNGKDAEKATLSEYRECWNGTFAAEQSEPGGRPGAVSEDAETAVRQALERVVRGEKVFFCTGLPEEMPEPDVAADGDGGRSIKRSDGMSDHETSAHGVKGRLVWAAVIAGLLCGAVIWTLVFR